MNAKLWCLCTSFRASVAELSSRPLTVNYPAVQAAEEEIVQRLANIDRLAQLQTDPVKTKTIARNDVFDAACAAASVVGNRAASYAHAHAAHDLAARVSLRGFDRLRLPVKLLHLQKLHAAVVPLAEALAPYGVDAAMLVDLQAKIEAAQTAFDATRLSVTARKAATWTLAREIAALNRFFRQRVDPLVESVGQAHPEFHTRYTAARIVIARPGQAAADDENPVSPAASAMPVPSSTALPLAA